VRTSSSPVGGISRLVQNGETLELFVVPTESVNETGFAPVICTDGADSAHDDAMGTEPQFAVSPMAPVKPLCP
jgi:hypothetical protein